MLSLDMVVDHGRPAVEAFPPLTSGNSMSDQTIPADSMESATAAPITQTAIEIPPSAVSASAGADLNFLFIMSSGSYSSI
jgi:hypothetical protein